MSPIAYLVLRRVPDETLAVGEGDVRRRRAVTHVVGDDLDPAREENTRSKIPLSSVLVILVVVHRARHRPHHRVSRARSRCVRSRAVAAETPRASRLDLDPSPHPYGRPTERHTHKKKPRVPSRASRVASPPTTARPSSLSPPFPSSSSIEIAASAEKNAPSTTHRARDSNAPIVLPDTDARIRRAEIDPDRGTFSLTHDDSRCA